MSIQLTYHMIYFTTWLAVDDVSFQSFHLMGIFIPKKTNSTFIRDKKQQEGAVIIEQGLAVISRLERGGSILRFLSKPI